MASATKIRTKDEVIVKCREVHGNEYDYSKIEYKNNRTKMCIICPEHGEFWQNYKNHVTLGKGCPKCGRIQLWKKRHLNFVPKPKKMIKKYKKCPVITYDIFIERAKEIHGKKYDYSKVEYINSQTKVCIICPEHGEFWQKPYNHLLGYGCSKCGRVYRYNTEEFIEKAKEIHGDRYDYSKVKYVNNRTPVCIICPIHGEFYQTPLVHLNHRGCNLCNIENKRNTFSFTTEQFIEKAKKIHGDRYDYSKVDYKNNNIKICIICQEHGEFYQTPSSHLSGNGCPKCHQSKLENEMRLFLENNNINFIWQKSFEWLKNKDKLYLDFYLPDYNIAIECQGIQHFKPVNYFGGKKGFKLQRDRDVIKKDLCTKHNIKILYYTNIEEDYTFFNKVIKNKNKILTIIKN